MGTWLGSAMRELGRYRLVARLARGGMGVVYLAILRGPRGFHKLLAIKELRRDLVGDSALRTMFLDEARLAARLNHPNLAQTIEVGSSDGRYFIAMEYLEGQSLQRIMQRAREHGVHLPLAMHLGVQIDVLAALDYAHGLVDYDGAPLDVVHQDVSPHNVLVTYEGQVKLVDFGVAQSLDGSAGMRIGVIKGKTKYMAPEQAACARVDHRADIFSVGVMLFEAIARRRPWEGRRDGDILRSLLEGAIPRLRDARPGIDPALCTIVDRAMSVDPEARYPTALAMRSDLETFMKARAIPTQRSPPRAALVSELFSEDRRRLRALVEAQLSGAGDHDLDPEAFVLPSERPASPLSSAERDGAGQNSSRPPTQLAMAVSVGPNGRAQPAAAPVAPGPAKLADSAVDPSADTWPSGGLRVAGRPRTGGLLVAGPTEDGGAARRSGRPRTGGLRVAGLAALGALCALYVGGGASPDDAARSEASRATPSSAAEAAPSAEVPRTSRVVVRASPLFATVTLDDENVGNPYSTLEPRSATTHRLRVEAPGYETRVVSVTFAADVAIEIALQLVEAQSERAAAQRAAPTQGATQGAGGAPAARLQPPSQPATMPGRAPIDTIAAHRL